MKVLEKLQTRKFTFYNENIFHEKSLFDFTENGSSRDFSRQILIVKNQISLYSVYLNGYN